VSTGEARPHYFDLEGTMPNHQPRRWSPPRRSRSSRPRIEALEGRLLLDYGASPVFARLFGNLDRPFATDVISLRISTNDFSLPHHRDLFVFSVHPEGSSPFRPGRVRLEGPRRGEARFLAVHRSPSQKTTGIVALAPVRPGTLTLLVGARSGTYGAFEVDVSLALNQAHPVASVRR
jgi:hypothetical protein